MSGRMRIRDRLISTFFFQSLAHSWVVSTKLLACSNNGLTFFGSRKNYLSSRRIIFQVWKLFFKSENSTSVHQLPSLPNAFRLFIFRALASSFQSRVLSHWSPPPSFFRITNHVRAFCFHRPSFLTLWASFVINLETTTRWFCFLSRILFVYFQWLKVERIRCWFILLPLFPPVFLFPSGWTIGIRWRILATLVRPWLMRAFKIRVSASFDAFSAASFRYSFFITIMFTPIVSFSW